jgi:type II restriction enzyme
MRLGSVYEAKQYIMQATPDNFSLKKLTAMFRQTPGLRRSIDKMYEIAVYALFSTIVRALRAQITLELTNADREILRDFEPFLKMVLGLDANKVKITMPALLYRSGVTNAADRGIDMWSNFGPVVQVKHLTLTPEIVEDIAEGIRADRIVIVCVDAEKGKIESLMRQVGWGEKIRGIITLNDLDSWYALCLGAKYRGLLGKTLLKDLVREFESEFPSSEEIEPFMKERGYGKIMLPKGWG